MPKYRGTLTIDLEVETYRAEALSIKLAELQRKVWELFGPGAHIIDTLQEVEGEEIGGRVSEPGQSLPETREWGTTFNPGAGGGERAGGKFSLYEL